MDALRATFALPPGTSSAALTRVLASLHRGGAGGGGDDGDDAREAPTTSNDSSALIAAAVAAVDDDVDDDDAVADDDASSAMKSPPRERGRRVPLEMVSEAIVDGERLARRRASTLKLEARAREALVNELRARVHYLEKENRALTHARVRATVEAVTRTSTGRGEEESAPPGDTPPALARAWSSLTHVARLGNAEVGLLLKQYKTTRRDKMRAYDRISELENELVKARQEVSVIDAFVKENIKARAAAEAIVEDDAEEKLVLRAKLKDAHEESGTLRARLATQTAALESSRANERTLRDTMLTLEKQLARCSMTRDKYRDVCHRLEEVESDRAGLKVNLAHVEAECEMLASMVRDMRKSRGFDVRIFERAAEVALLANHDGVHGVSQLVTEPETHVARVEMEDAPSAFEHEVGDDVAASPETPHMPPSVIDPEDVEFISPRIQRAPNRAVSTPESASSSATFHF